MSVKISKIHSRVLAAAEKKEVAEAGAVAFDSLSAFYIVNSKQMDQVNAKVVELLSTESVAEKVKKLTPEQSLSLADKINAYRADYNSFKEKMAATYERHKDRTGRPKSAEDMQLVHSCSNEYSRILEYYDSNVIPLTADISDLVYSEDAAAAQAQDPSVVTDVQVKA
jgi:hypothetical protein